MKYTKKYSIINNDNCGIYMIRNKVNDKKYIGQSHNISWRWYQHKTSLNHNRCENRHLQYSWNKYGKDSFEFSIIELCPVEMLDEKETYWIDYYDSTQTGYNIRLGGNSSRGWKMTEEARKNISNALKGRTFSKEHCDNIKKAQKKYYLTHIPATSRVVICLNTKERFVNAKEANKKYPSADASALHECCKGRHLSCGKDENGIHLVWAYEEDYKKLSEDDIKEKLINVGGKASGKSQSKPVLCITTNIIFNSLKEAAQYYKTSISNLNGCLKGRQKTAGKDPETNKPLYWAYCG